jgi:hypothetical protein
MTVSPPRTHFLTDFPSLASCPLCVVYTNHHLTRVCGQDALTAAVVYHDSAHMNDPFDPDGGTWADSRRTTAPGAVRPNLPRQACAPSGSLHLSPQ